MINQLVNNIKWIRQIKRLLITLCLGGLAGINAGLADEKPFVLNVATGAPLYQEDGTGFYNLLAAEIFERLDLDMKMVKLPSERALVNANGGVDDGNIARVAGLEKKYSNLVRVPEKVFDFEFVVYSKNPDVEINDWNSLKPYVVGIINGWKIVEKNVTEVKKLTKVKNYAQLLTLLENGRVEIAILDRLMGGWQLQQLGFDITLIEPPITAKPMFIYVHRKHQALVPEMVKVLKDMKEDGTYDDIFNRSLGDFIQN